jgi:hypothetical protein
MNENYFIHDDKKYSNLNNNNYNHIVQIIENNFNVDLVYEDVFFSHAIEMLKFPIPKAFISKNFIIQEDINGLLINIKGVHGWDKPYLNINYHKNVLKKYTVKLLKKINSKYLLSEYINRDNINIYDYISTINYEERLENSEYILIIYHNMGGGTEKYVKDLIQINKESIIKKNLQKKLIFDIIKIVESNNQTTNILYNDIPLKLVQNSQNIFLNKMYDIIHIHYLNEPAFILYNYIMELLTLSYAPKLYITLHDYHFIINDKSNEYHLTTFNANKQFLDKLKEQHSNICTYKLFKNLFLKSNLIITGSTTLKVIYNYVFELSNDLIKIVQHPEPIYFQPIPKNVISYSYLNIGVIGGISLSKGSYIIQDMSLFFKNKKLPWKIYHFGIGYKKNLRKSSEIITIGSYQSENSLKNKLIENKINLLWFPVFRHESYCYTLTIAMQTGLPILAYDSGTFRERLSFYDSPYKIHECNYNCESLFNDIKNFYEQLKYNNYNRSSTTDFIYDDINYDNIYYL